MDVNRKTSYLTLRDVFTRQAYSNLALQKQIILNKPDYVPFVRQLVYGVLENKIYLDYIIKNFLKNPKEEMKSPEMIILRMGLYQIIYMNSVPAYAAIDQSVELAKKYCSKKAGLVNAILRNYMRNGEKIEFPDEEKNEIEYLETKYSYEKWIVKMWLSNYGRTFAEELMIAGNAAPILVIRPNLLKTTGEELKNFLTKMGHTVKSGKISENALYVKGQDILGGRLHESGLFSVMDEAAMRVVEILDPKPGEFIIDVCAAPGGKTVYIAEKMKNTGSVLARDIYKNKLKLVNSAALRNEIDIIKTEIFDALKVDKKLYKKADRILLDVPCSGLGVVRRRPEIKYKKYDEKMRELPVLQTKILENASYYVKDGGVLVYSTCTMKADENYKIVDAFLRKHSEFEKVESIQLLPNIDGTDGFYICKMRKSER